jgi:hypothetical protein
MVNEFEVIVGFDRAVFAIDVYVGIPRKPVQFAFVEDRVQNGKSCQIAVRTQAECGSLRGVCVKLTRT